MISAALRGAGYCAATAVGVVAAKQLLLAGIWQRVAAAEEDAEVFAPYSLQTWRPAVAEPPQPQWWEIDVPRTSERRVTFGPEIAAPFDRYDDYDAWAAAEGRVRSPIDLLSVTPTDSAMAGSRRRVVRQAPHSPLCA